MSDNEIKVSMSENGDVLIMKIEDERINSMVAPALKTEFLKLAAAGKKKLLVNMSSVRMVDSSGLGALTFGKRQLDETGSELVICCLDEKVLSLFKISKLDMVFDIYENQDEAVKSMV